MCIWFPDEPVLLSYTFVTARYMMFIWFPDKPVLKVILLLQLDT